MSCRCYGPSFAEALRPEQHGLWSPKSFQGTYFGLVGALGPRTTYMEWAPKRPDVSSKFRRLKLADTSVNLHQGCEKKYLYLVLEYS